jgi:hypothetical protein
MGADLRPNRGKGQKNPVLELPYRSGTLSWSGSAPRIDPNRHPSATPLLIIAERRVASQWRGGRQYQSVTAAAPTGANGNTGPHQRSTTLVADLVDDFYNMG